MANSRLQAQVYGYVQGVNFRWYTRRNATRLGLKGYVRNCEDGTVEVVAEGEQDALQELLDWLHRGPSLARVEKVEAEWEEATGEYGTFEVRY